jgi:uncharacterized DUF497 family protein
VTAGPRFVWDEEKSRSNLARHRVSFEFAAAVFDDPDHLVDDDQFALGEYRLVAIGSIGPVVLAVVFSEPAEDVIRLISARRATPAERRAYDQARR